MLTKTESAGWTTESIEKQVRQIVAEIAARNPADIALEATWRASGIDSLDMFSILTNCEQVFGIEISDSEAIYLTSARQLITRIAQLISAPPSQR